MKKLSFIFFVSGIALALVSLLLLAITFPVDPEGTDTIAQIQTTIFGGGVFIGLALLFLSFLSVIGGFVLYFLGKTKKSTSKIKAKQKEGSLNLIENRYKFFYSWFSLATTCIPVGFIFNLISIKTIPAHQPFPAIELFLISWFLTSVVFTYLIIQAWEIDLSLKEKQQLLKTNLLTFLIIIFATLLLSVF